MRSGRRIRVRHSFYLCSVLLLLCFALPRFGGANHLWQNGLYEAFCIVAVFPVIVAMGAGGANPADASKRLCRQLGDISYPLYLTHYPLIYIYTAWISERPRSLGERAGWGVLLWVTSVGMAYVCLKLYDEPVRAWLSRRFLRRSLAVVGMDVPGSDPAFPAESARL